MSRRIRVICETLDSRIPSFVCSREVLFDRTGDPLVDQIASNLRDRCNISETAALSVAIGLSLFNANSYAIAEHLPLKELRLSIGKLVSQ